MAKKTRREKELARLRREVEVLRAQKGGEAQKTKEIHEPGKTEPEIRTTKAILPQVDIKYIKSDLLKTVILTAIAFGIIAAAYLLRNQIPYL